MLANCWLFILVLSLIHMAVPWVSSFQTLHVSCSFHTRQHLSTACGLCMAAIGTTGLSHHTFFPLFLSLTTPTISPSPCLQLLLFKSPCVLSVVFGNGVITGQTISHFLPWVVCLLPLSFPPLFSLSFYPPCDLPMAVLCHLYIQDILSFTNVTHNALLNSHLIFILRHLSPSQTKKMWTE